MKIMILDVGCGKAAVGDVNLDIKKQQVPDFVQADAQHLPFVDNAFDRVVSTHCIEHVDSPTKAILEMLRVTKDSVEIYTPWHNRFVFFDLLGFNKDKKEYRYSITIEWYAYPEQLKITLRKLT